MGLFSESVTTYASQVLSLIEENPKFIPSTIRNAILAGQDIAASLQSALTNNIALDAKRYYSYGKNYYYYGLPTGTFAGYYVDLSVLGSVLETIENNPVIIDSANMSDTPDGRFFIFSWLDDHSYDWDTDIFTYHLHSCTLISAEVIANNAVKIVYTYQQYNYSTGEYDTITTTDTIAAFVYYSELYITATYYLLDAESLPTGDAIHFVYRINDNTYPDLSPEDTEVQKAPYYPIVPIRLFNTSLSELDAYPTAKRLVKKLGLNIDNVLEGVESNPDIADIDNAFIVIGFNMDSTNSSVINYMYEFFSFLYNNIIYTEADFNNWDLNFASGDVTSAPPMNSLTIEDAQYKAKVNYRFIRQEIITGSIGAINTVDKQINIKPKLYYSQTNSDNHISTSFYIENSELVLRKQITENTYQQLTIVGLLHTNYIKGPGAVESTLKQVVNDTDNNNFIIPLNSYIFNNTLSATQRIDLMYECIQLVINCWKKTKLKWYQTGFFQIVMIILTVAITIVAPPIGSGLATATTATEAAIAIGTQIAITAAISVLLKVAVKVLGVNATIVAIVAVVAAMYGYRNMSGLSTMPWAMDLLQTVTSMMNGIGAALKDATQETISEMQKFATSAEDQLKTIYEKIDEMTSTNTLDPLMLFTKVDYYPTETVSDYYYRHCHMTNPGVLSLDIITDYVDTMLTLDY